MVSDDNPFPPPIDDPGDSSGPDPFGPPEVPCLCSCLHCGREFMSDGIWYERHVKNGIEFEGFWRCPTPNCDGAGFTFDIFPVDPDHPANEGWHYSDDDDEQGWNEEDDAEPSPESEPYDPAEPEYAALDDHDDNIEGEEWKHGLSPGETPPESPRRAAARREWEAEQAKYDAPDERPRVIDHTGEPDPPARAPRPPRPPGTEDDGIDEGDIPF
jgi:hypothetical protein